MKTQANYTAVLADDEPLLLESMQKELKAVWPELRVVATASNGPDAIKAIVEYEPNVVFLDIQMPGATGLDVGEAIAEDWPENNESTDKGTDQTTGQNTGQGTGQNTDQNTDQSAGEKKPLPLIVFATAFDDFAIDAFEAAAVDYLVKPIKKERLALSVTRLKARLQSNDLKAADQLAEQLHQLLTHQKRQDAATDSVPLLKVIRASSGSKTRIIPIEEVILFESADKYVTVHTKEGESLIREPLKKLLPQLDANKFEQVHRGSIVQVAMIESAHRDETGKVTLEFKGIDKRVTVSRVYRHLFQPM